MSPPQEPEAEFCYLKPTPAVPPELLNIEQLAPNAETLLRKRYLRKGEDGEAVEEIPQMFWRVSWHVAEPEPEEEREMVATHFYRLLTTRKFFPNSPTFTGAGIKGGNLAACYVLRIKDDMGKEEDGIFRTLTNAALVQQLGGGNGFDFSELREEGAYIRSSGGRSSGPLGFLKVYDQAFGMIAQGGTRRGANMAVLRVDHPSIRKFITCKSQGENAITNFNISVALTDEFMRAVKNNQKYKLISPNTGKVREEVEAREIWDLIVENAHLNGEPGVLFIDTANRANPVPHLYWLQATNPCVSGETWVLTEDGPRQVNQILGKQTRLMIDGILHSTTQDGFFQTGVKPVLKIRTKRGYQIEVTDNHLMRQVIKKTRHATDCNWVPAGELKVGDQLLFSNNSGPIWWDGNGTRGQGYLLGSLVGDGWFGSRGDAILGIWGDDDGVISSKNYIEQVVRSELKTGPCFRGFNEAKEKHWRLSCIGLTELAQSFGLSPHFKGVTPEIEKSSSDFYIGFLQGFFDCDGCVQGQQEKGISLRLSQSDIPRLEGVQRMLQRLGIMSTIYLDRRPEQEKNFGERTYVCRAQHELVISGQNLELYSDRIGFINNINTSKLRNLLSAFVRKPNRERYVDCIDVITKGDSVPVYDVQVPGINAFDANGFYVHNCGEQWLGPNENCCLGSINLSMYVIDGVVDWEGLKRDVGLAVRFLDDVIDANEYVPSLPQLKQAAQNCRRIGLGIMGLGDAMYMCGIRYGSLQAQEFASQIMEWVRFWAMSVSVELAKTRGPFPAIGGSIYDPKGCPKMVERFGHEFPGRGEKTMWWQPPTPLVPHTTDFGRPNVNWLELKLAIIRWGIRNAAQTTVAPTGTIASVASCESYGCEPVFALAYVRHVNDNGKDLALNYVSPLFMKALQKAGLDEAAQQRVITRVLSEGTCQALAEDLPPNIVNTFVVSMDITAEEHVAMQAAIQAFVDNSMSKTCNFPEGTSKEEVSKAYFDAWEKNCKGLTVYVAGSRTKVVLETNAEAKRKEEQKNEVAEESPKAKNKELEGKAKSEMAIKHILHGGSMDSDPSDDSEDGPSSSSGPRMIAIKKSCDCNKKAIGMRRQRPKRLRGETSSVMTPIGNAFVTINEDSNGYPFETFISVGKTGSVVSSLTQPLARLASACLRIVEPEESWLALEIIISQLDGIKDGRSVGFGENKVHSLPDGVAKILKEYVINKTTRVNSKELTAFIDLKKTTDGEQPQQQTETKKPAIVLPPGVEADICRECGECAVVEQEGCSRCYNCLVGTC